MSVRSRLRVFTGTANPQLTADICEFLNIPLGRIALRQFSDGEIHLQIKENVRGMDVFVVQPTSTPVDRHLMELLLIMDALRRASAKRITAVLPYYGYSRQDRKDRPRVPISSKLVASLLVAAGADRVLTLDLHAAQIQGFFDIPVDHLYGRPSPGGVHQDAPPAAAQGHLARRWRRRAGTGIRQAPQRSARDYRQAPRGGQRLRGGACHWRGRRA